MYTGVQCVSWNCNVLSQRQHHLLHDKPHGRLTFSLDTTFSGSPALQHPVSCKRTRVQEGDPANGRWSV